MSAGNEIQIQTVTGTHRSEVDWVQVVAPDETAVLAPSTRSSIALVNCYPFHFIGSAPQRFVVRAQKD
jgi:sortase A